MPQRKPDTIRKLREEIAKARAKGMDDSDIIVALTNALTREQLVEVYKSAVRENRSSLSAAIESTLFGADETAQRVTKSYDNTVEGKIAESFDNRRSIGATRKSARTKSGGNAAFDRVLKAKPSDVLNQ